MGRRLTQSPTFHFLVRDRKNGQYLGHNLNDYACHGVSVIINVGVNLEPAEETFDAVKEVNEFVSARAGILSRL
jgi:hypothetical protein